MPRQQNNRSHSTSSGHVFPRPSTPSHYPRPSNAQVQLPAPKIWHQAPQVQPSMMQTMKEGFGFGMGSAAGHAIFRSMFGGPTATQVSPSELPKEYYPKEYAECILQNEKNQEVCKPFMSKDKSIWKECMESHAYDAEVCKGVY